MNTYILKIHWESEHKAKDLDHLRKWLVNLYDNDKVKVMVYIKTNTGTGKRFVGMFATELGLPVWYTKFPFETIFDDYRVIDEKTGTLLKEDVSKGMMSRMMWERGDSRL